MFEYCAVHDCDKYEDEREGIARRFRDNYGSRHETGRLRRSSAAPYFFGVIDTVAALSSTSLDAVDSGAFIDNPKQSPETIRILKAYDASSMPVVVN